MPELIETIEDGVATLTFNRPERMNALSTLDHPEQRELRDVDPQRRERVVLD